MTDAVRISELTVPDSAQLNDIIKIHVKSEASNGCWKNLYFKLDHADDFTYIVTSYGTFESYGICPAIMVYGDTLMNFLCVNKGKYIFIANERKFTILTDTLTVF
jgi:hypothetical protein